MKERSLREAREDAGLSLRQAAEQLGISHAYLSGLELGHKPLSPGRARDLAKLYRVPENISLVQPVPHDKEEFQSWLTNQLKWWDSRFLLPMVPGVSRLITSLYVTPYCSLENGDGRSGTDVLKILFSAPENRALLLAGDIGSGKSFFLRVLALELVDILGSLSVDEKFVPFFVSLGQFEPSSSPLPVTLANYYAAIGFDASVTQLTQFIRQCVDRGNALLLFDGLDEIHDQRRRSEVFALLQRAFEAELRPHGNRMVISGRPEAFFSRDRHYDGFFRAKLEPWSSIQMLEAARRWAASDEETAESFLHVLRVNDFIFRLARWPLLFHLLTTLHSSSGMKAFQGRSGLCDDCCRVLENTWDSARRAFHTPDAVRRPDVLSVHSWIKWRHFLIHLMERCLEEFARTGEPIPTLFSETHIRDAWEDFLARRGVERSSLDFAKLEALLSNQNRVGPLIRSRVSAGEPSQSYREGFAFLDPIFGNFYSAKALLNHPERLPDLVASRARDLKFQEIVPLVIEELGRSERAYENQLADSLFDVLLRTDDRLGLDRQHAIGHFGIFTATRTVGAFNPDKYFDRVIEPFLKIYMFSMFVSDAETSNQILGELSVSVKIRDYFYGRFREIFDNGKARDPAFWEEKWRVLAGLGRFGEQQDVIADELVRDARIFSDPDGKESLSDAINIRRLLLALRQIGRIFVLEKELTAAVQEKKFARIQKIKAAILNFVDFALESIRRQRRTNEYLDFHFWDSLPAVLLTFEQLRYEHELHEVLEKLMTFVLEAEIPAREPAKHRKGYLQFLKGLSVYSPLTSNANRQSILRMLERAGLAAAPDEKRELALIARCFSLSQLDFMDPAKQWSVLVECYCGGVEPTIGTLAERLCAMQKSAERDHIELGNLLVTTCYLVRNSESVISQDALATLVGPLLELLRLEREAPEAVKDAERIYTRPFSAYSFPLYDHLYDALCLIARSLETRVEKSNGKFATI